MVTMTQHRLWRRPSLDDQWVKFDDDNVTPCHLDSLDSGWTVVKILGPGLGNIQKTVGNHHFS
jgi:methanogenic corrinoid protein MtbC1